MKQHEELMAIDEPPEKKRWRDRLGIKIAVGSLALTLAFGAFWKKEQSTESKVNDAQAQLNSLAAAMGRMAGVDPSVVLRQGLSKPEDLPGYGKKVAETQKQQLAAASVTILSRLKGTSNTWTEDCSGTKISSGAQSYILTAQHCLSFSYSLPKGLAPSFNALPADANDYAIVDPTSSVNDRDNGIPMATVSAASVITNGVDVALLQVTEQDPSYKSRRFSDIASLSIDQLLAIQPVAGEEAALYGTSGALNHTPLASTGIFLGNIDTLRGSKADYDYPTTRRFDIVGIQAATDQQNGCYYQTSGSSALLESGYLTGPSSFHTYYPPPIEAPPNADDYVLDELDRLRIEARLHLNLDQYNVLCAYAAFEASDLQLLVDVLPAVKG